ncbi:MAG: hypothetical protein CMH57_09245 [Myxococcales bacterium]|nr:hypothetical protein [Myxococcales bacterium]
MTDIPLSVSPESFGPREDLPVGQVLRQFAERGLGVASAEDAPLTSNQLGLVLSMRHHGAHQEPFRLSSHEPIYRTHRQNMHMDVGARYLPVRLDPWFGKYDAVEAQELIPRGGWSYSLSADLLKLWIDEEIDAELGLEEAEKKARKKTKKAVVAAAAKTPVQPRAQVPAAVRRALQPDKKRLKQAVLSAARGDTSQLATMLHGDEVARIMSRVEARRAAASPERSMLVSGVGEVAAAGASTAAASGSPARSSLTATSLDAEVLGELAATHPTLSVDASSPEMTIEGAAKQVLARTQAQARRQARRQLLGMTPVSTPSASEVHKTPGLLAASAEQRAVRTAIGLARMFSPSSVETERIAEATLAGTPLDRFLGRPPLGTTTLSTLAPSAERAGERREAMSVMTARQALSLDAWAARPEAAADAMASLESEGGAPVGRTARRTVDFGGTALRALTVAEGTSGVVGRAGAPSLTWMRRGGRGALLEGMIGGAPVEEKADVAAANARVKPATALTPSPTAATSAGSTSANVAYPAGMGAAARVAASLVAPPAVVTMAQAEPRRTGALQSDAFARAAVTRVAAPSLSATAQAETPTATAAAAPLTQVTPAPRAVSRQVQFVEGAATPQGAPGAAPSTPSSIGARRAAPLGVMEPAHVGLYETILASGAAPSLYDSYDATSEGDFAEMVARATLTRPALRQAMLRGQMGGVAQLTRRAEQLAGAPLEGERAAEGAAMADVELGLVQLPDAGAPRSVLGRSFTPGAARAALSASAQASAAAAPSPERPGGRDEVELGGDEGFRRSAPVQLQDVMVSPRYLPALTHGMERVHRSLSLLSRLNPMSLRPGVSAPSVRPRAMGRRPVTALGLAQLSAVANGLATDLVAGEQVGSRDWAVGSWIAEDKLNQDWRLAEVANQIAEVIRGNYNIDAHQARQRAQARRAMTSWGPNAVYVQLPEQRAEVKTEDELPEGSLAARQRRAAKAQAARRAIDEAVQKALTAQQQQQQEQQRLASASGVTSIRQLVQPTAPPTRAAAAALEAASRGEAVAQGQAAQQAFEARVRAEEVAARSLRLFSPEKTLAMLAPQLESGGLLNPVDRAELTQALQALASSRATTSAPRRLRTAFGTLTLQMKGGELVVDAEELSSNAPMVSMRTSPTATQAAPVTAPTRQALRLATAPMATAAASVAGAPTTAAGIAPAGVSARPQPTRQLAQPVQVALGMPSRAERGAGVRLDPPSARQMARTLTTSGQLAQLSREERSALTTAVAAAEGRQPIALLGGVSGGERIEIFAGSGQAARLAQAVARAVTAAPSPTLGTSLTASAAGESVLRRLMAERPELASAAMASDEARSALERLDAPKLAEALTTLSNRRDLMGAGLAALAGAAGMDDAVGDEARWSTRASARTMALSEVLSEAAARRSSGALGMLGMARPAGGPFRNVSRADLAYALPYMQRSTGDLKQVGAQARRMAVAARRRAVSQAEVTRAEALAEVEQAVTREAAQTRAVVTRATRAVEQVVPALQSLSGRQLMDLSLSLGRGNSLRQAAQSLGLSNGVLSALSELEALPATADALPGSLAGPEGFGATLRSLPAMVMQAAASAAPAAGPSDPTMAAIDARLAQMGERPMSEQTPGRFSELTVLDPALGALSERLAEGGVATEAAQALRAPLSSFVSESRAARRRAQRARRMLPAIDRALASVGSARGAAQRRGVRGGGPSLKPQALGGSMLRRLKNVESVLEAFGDVTSAGDRPRRGLPRMFMQAAGLPKELIAPMSLRQAAQRAQEQVRRAQQASAGSSAAASVDAVVAASPGEVAAAAEALARGGDDVALGRAGMVGLWLPSSVERALGQDMDTLVGGSGSLAGAYVLPQLFSGRQMSQERTMVSTRQGGAEQRVRVRGDALRRTAHGMALGLQSLATPSGGARSVGRGVTVGVGSGALSWSPWMTSTPAQDGTRRIMALLGMGELGAEQVSMRAPSASASASAGAPAMSVVMPQLGGDAPGPEAPERPTAYGGLSRTLLRRATVQPSASVRQGRTQGVEMATKRELFSPFQAPPADDAKGADIVARASTTASTGGGGGGSSSASGGGGDGGGGGSVSKVDIEETAREVLAEIKRRLAMELERRGEY